MSTSLRHVLTIVVATFVTQGAQLAAHHSFAAEFDASKPVTLRGTLTRVDWVNPHGWLYMDVKNDKGEVESWAIEAGAPNALIRRGLRKTSFPPGMELVVKGFLAKDGSHTANGRAVTLPDGKEFFTGAAGGPEDGAERKREE